MTATTVKPMGLASRLVSGILQIQPLFNIARKRARSMMVQRASQIGVDWPARTAALRQRQSEQSFSPDWEQDLQALTNPDLQYPSYYVAPFHAYPEGNLGWEPAMEVEVAALSVHARIWPEAGAQGDAQLRASYHQVLKEQLPTAPQRILDIGCSVGMSTFTLQDTFPQAAIAGLDLSPYFLAVAKYQAEQAGRSIQWHHAAAEATGLPDQSFDLISACLVFHELPAQAAQDILKEARRLLPVGGHIALMDMNPQSDVFAKMPPYILTLLKSTEPYIDEYFSLDLDAVFQAAGFTTPTRICNSPRHHTLIAQAV
ncbi:class I SAM-dependent methyltransferase [Synechococcus elongatus]|uniref:class I SAM-dependent methyltransferase n=1 Tax=Synechococcus elongatus TaxID=32046 RepID=UPI000F7E8B9A|nr:class I SAM-dependent methyltransferase [Synechococcus elongatus]